MAHKQPSYLSRVANATIGFLSPKKNDESLLQSEHRARCAKYATNWREYRGETLDGMAEEDGRAHDPINLLKKNIDKVNYFAFGKGFTLINEEYTKHLETVEAVWGLQFIQKILKIGQFGSVCGDAYIMVAPTQVSKGLAKFDPKKAEIIGIAGAAISIVAVDPSFCTPVYDSFDTDRLLAMSIDIPTKTYDPKTGFQHGYQHMTITADLIYTESRDNSGKALHDSASEVVNPIGEVYVHHIRNYPDGNSLYGADDVADVAPLNKAISKDINAISQILDYSGDPITVIYGARAKNLTKGKNKIWGSLPKDARVENLELGSDLSAATGHVEKLTESLYALMGVPEIAQGTKQAISNTSGTALGVMYMPLIEKADTKHSLYAPHLIEVAITVLRWVQHLKIDVLGIESDGRAKKLTETDFAKIRLNTEVSFPSVLPKDKLIEAQIQTTLREAYLQDQAGALVALGEKDPAGKIKKIDADAKKAAKAALAAMPPALDPLATAPKAKKPKKIESGASPSTGINTGDSEEQKGRPKT